MDVRAENLAMQFNDAGRIVEVFTSLNLNIPRGTSAAIIGRSGVGKTTLLNLFGGLELPTTGDVYIGEACLSEMQRQKKDVAAFRGKNIGFIFQFHHLLPEFDAVENVAMPLLIQGTSKEDAFGRAEELLTRVGLKDRFNHRPGQLSGGEQQRVAIARALSPSPGVLLADEPTGDLDHVTAAQVTELLLELHRETGASLLLVTHSRELAAKMDCIYELKPNGIQLTNKGVDRDADVQHSS